MLLAVVFVTAGCGRFGYETTPLVFPCDDEGASCDTDVGTGTCIAGSCCLGCVDSAGTCVRGRSADGCGTGGAACTVCDAASFCERQQCVLGADSRRFALGHQFGCAIVDGALFCWGENDDGELGTGDGQDRLTPVRVGDDADWIAISAGLDFACGVRGAGELYCWGVGDGGALLQGDFASRSTPTRVGTATDWVRVDTGHRYTCAINAAGELWCGGLNTEAQLGQGFRTSPADVGIPMLTQVGTDANWAAVSCGRGHNCGLTNADNVVCWGANDDSQQGHAGGGNSPMTLPGAAGWTGLRAGSESTCAFRGDDMSCWGENVNGLLGNGNIDDIVMTPQFVSGDFRMWSPNLFHGCAIRDTGALACAGRAIEGQLGIDDSDAQLAFIEPDIGGTDWVEVETGRFFTCARKRDGSIYCSGANGSGQLGLGDTDRRDSFEALTFDQP